MTGVFLIVLIGALVWWVIARARSERTTALRRADSEGALYLGSKGAAGPERDSWEGAFWEVRNPLDVDALIHLHYTDAHGNRTERVVRTRSFEDQPTGLLIGQCQLRDATRTFRFDRVRQAVDAATGEIVADLRGHLRRIYASSPERVRESLESDFAAVLKVLLYVAKADGQYRREEKVVVRAFLRDLVGDARLTDEMIDRILQGMAGPSLQGFKVALARVHSEQLVDPHRLYAACQQIVATQSTVSAGEREALDYMERQLPTLQAPYAQALA